MLGQKGRPRTWARTHQHDWTEWMPSGMTRVYRKCERGNCGAYQYRKAT